MMAGEFRTAALQGQKVVLREKQISDAGNDYAWGMDSELMRLDAAEPYQISYSVFLRSYAESIRDPNKRQFAIETLTGKHIGNCVCYNIDWLQGEAEVGVMIGDREYWGKGYGADAVRTLMRYAFGTMGIRKLCLHTLEWNIRAQECFARCGFVPVDKIVHRGLEFIRMEASKASMPESSSMFNADPE